MTTGSRSLGKIVATVLGQLRFKEMSKQHLLIAYNPSVKPHGQFIAKRRIKEAKSHATTRVLYGSGTRCASDSFESRATAIWRVYNDYVRIEMLRPSSEDVAIDADLEDDLGELLADSSASDSGDDDADD